MITKSELFPREKEINPNDSSIIEDFIIKFEAKYDFKFYIGKGYRVKDKFKSDIASKKTSLFITGPRLDEAEEISSIFKEAYQNSYPYKEYENIEYVQKTIKHPNYHWLVYKTKKGVITGCFMAIIDREKKHGNYGRFAFFPKYQGIVDVAKASFGTMYLMFDLYKNVISTWWGEARTAHNKSSYVASCCGIKPVAFLPNKDSYFNSKESEILQIGYFKDVFKRRCKSPPLIIPKVLNCFLYSSFKFQIGPVELINKNLIYKKNKIKSLKDEIENHLISKNFDCHFFSLNFRNSNSYFKFSCYPHSKIIENIKYQINDIEEFICFISKLMEIIDKKAIQYCELIISAYKPFHQQVLLNSGFKPTGYIPCWEYDEAKDIYKDCIIFNYNSEEIMNPHIQLIPESLKLLETLNFIVS